MSNQGHPTPTTASANLKALSSASTGLAPDLCAVPSGDRFANLIRFDDLAPHLAGGQWTQEGADWRGPCPAHGGDGPNCHIYRGDAGTASGKCHSHGCSIKEIAAALGVRGPSRSFGTNQFSTATRDSHRKIIATYPYTDETNALLYEVQRYSPKTFRQRRPDGRGGWLWNLEGVRRVLFRLSDVLAAVAAGQRVWLCEGEKDALNLSNLGLTATTAAQGTGFTSGDPARWRETFTGPLKGAHVVILPDNDDPGRAHAERVASVLHGGAASVRVLGLPGLETKQDVTDWLLSARQRHGGDLSAIRAELESLAEAAGEWTATAPITGGDAGHAESALPLFDAAPAPLSADLLPVPQLDPALLPASLRGWACDIAARASLPMEYVAAAALVALSAVVGRRVGIRPKRFDDWTVVPNLWGAIVGPPGVQKTPAAQEALKPLHRLEAEARKAYDRALEEHQALTLVGKAQSEAAKDALKKAARSNRSTEELRSLAIEAASAEAEVPPPVWTRYLVNDTTVEKLGELLRDNPNGLLIFRDELTGFFKTLERQGHESDRAFYLEAWNGNGAFTCDRIGRGTVVIEAACLSVFGTIQPGPLAHYLRGAASGEEADGFAPRLQILVYPDPPKTFTNVDRWPDAAAKAAAFAVFHRLAHLDASAVGAEVEAPSEVSPVSPVPYLRFCPVAQAFFDQWRDGLELRLRSGSDTPLMQMHLAKYRSLLPSVALLLHLAEGATGPVSLPAAQAAAKWCAFLEAHARRIYQSAMDGDPEAAQRLAERIRQSLPNPFTVRQVVKKGWSGLATPEEVERAVGFLEERGWVQSVETPAGPQGGRPSALVYIHPALIMARDEPAEKPDEPDTTTRQNRQNQDLRGFAGFDGTSNQESEIFTGDLSDPFADDEEEAS